MSATIKAYRWNYHVDMKKPAPAFKVKDAHVKCPTFGEVTLMLGTARPRARYQNIHRSHLGVIRTPFGRQLVAPGDWVVLVDDEPIGAYSDAMYKLLFQSE